MSEIFTFFAGEVLLAAALVGLILHGRHRFGLKLAGLSLGAVAMLTSWLAITDLLSRPKPLILERRPALVGEAVVLAGRIVENEAIHVWLQLDGAAEPRAYSLPWDRRRAEELQRTLAQAERVGGITRMRLPPQGDDDAAPVFHAEPPPATPPKVVPPPVAIGGLPG